PRRNRYCNCGRTSALLEIRRVFDRSGASHSAMSKIDELMRQGLQLHQAGRIPEARALYEKVLQKQPSHPAANHLAGVAMLQLGDAAGAVPRLQQAVHVRGNDPDFLGNLGAALNAVGRPAEALAASDLSLQL